MHGNTSTPTTAEKDLPEQRPLRRGRSTHLQRLRTSLQAASHIFRAAPSAHRGSRRHWRHCGRACAGVVAGVAAQLFPRYLLLALVDAAASRIAVSVTAETSDTTGGSLAVVSFTSV